MIGDLDVENGHLDGENVCVDLKNGNMDVRISDVDIENDDMDKHVSDYGWDSFRFAHSLLGF